MTEKEIHAVTGAYGFSGKYGARRLLAEGKKVITLTDSLNRANGRFFRNIGVNDVF